MMKRLRKLCSTQGRLGFMALLHRYSRGDLDQLLEEWNLEMPKQQLETVAFPLGIGIL